MSDVQPRPRNRAASCSTDGGAVAITWSRVLRAVVSSVIAAPALARRIPVHRLYASSLGVSALDFGVLAWTPAEEGIAPLVTGDQRGTTGPGRCGVGVVGDQRGVRGGGTR
ncbi:hypothetical protein SAMN04489729_2621 [Amycolatopsis lurida]|uniref:Uncharacterized protein n=1 Tax=Amycolatopsis lurida NRRL 2430 TaxID=1460371 RepID=A0A2P2FFE5_AMYLU|nr:hypothetical protein [Amycolatopsis lurida]KFU75441.1 hypothetical protein BB31_41520 [Amycolatopsis lurida NRRL 2430]SEC84857.1 hypothetical protein SAMN04489729_2621 [Amycolatopsis lurida]